MNLNHELFLKVERKIAATFELLDRYTPQEKSLALMEMNEALWFLERVEPALFQKVIKDIKVKLEQLLLPINAVILEMDQAQVEDQKMVFIYRGTKYEFPLVSVAEAKSYLVENAPYFPGYFLQLAYLMRADNYLSLCLLKAHAQGKLCTV